MIKKDSGQTAASCRVAHSRGGGGGGSLLATHIGAV